MFVGAYLRDGKAYISFPKSFGMTSLRWEARKMGSCRLQTFCSAAFFATTNCIYSFYSEMHSDYTSTDKTQNY
jgi:hypothetical protein